MKEARRCFQQLVIIAIPGPEAFRVVVKGVVPLAPARSSIAGMLPWSMTI
jgi:hypothetical protein